MSDLLCYTEWQRMLLKRPQNFNRTFCPQEPSHPTASSSGRPINWSILNSYGSTCRITWSQPPLRQLGAFSVAALTCSDRRNGLKDDMFELLVVAKSNKDFFWSRLYYIVNYWCIRLWWNSAITWLQCCNKNRVVNVDIFSKLCLVKIQF